MPDFVGFSLILRATIRYINVFAAYLTSQVLLFESKILIIVDNLNAHSESLKNLFFFPKIKRFCQNKSRYESFLLALPGICSRLTLS